MCSRRPSTLPERPRLSPTALRACWTSTTTAAWTLTSAGRTPSLYRFDRFYWSATARDHSLRRGLYQVSLPDLCFSTTLIRMDWLKRSLLDRTRPGRTPSITSDLVPAASPALLRARFQVVLWV